MYLYLFTQCISIYRCYVYTFDMVYPKNQNDFYPFQFEASIIVHSILYLIVAFIYIHLISFSSKILFPVLRKTVQNTKLNENENKKKKKKNHVKPNRKMTILLFKEIPIGIIIINRENQIENPFIYSYIQIDTRTPFNTCTTFVHLDIYFVAFDSLLIFLTLSKWRNLSVTISTIQYKPQ